GWRDGALMELLADDWRREARGRRRTDGAAVARDVSGLDARTAREADVPALLEMMAEFNRLEQVAWTPEAGEAPLRMLLADPPLGVVGLLLMAGGAEPDAGQVAGYFVVTWGYDLEWGGRDAFLTELYLRSEVRGRALGAAAMAHVERAAVQAGARAL